MDYSNILLLEHSSNKLKNNFQIVMEAVKQNGNSIEYASNELKNNIQIENEAYKKIPPKLNLKMKFKNLKRYIEFYSNDEISISTSNIFEKIGDIPNFWTPNFIKFLKIFKDDFKYYQVPKIILSYYKDETKPQHISYKNQLKLWRNFRKNSKSDDAMYKGMCSFSQDFLNYTKVSIYRNFLNYLDAYIENDIQYFYFNFSFFDLKFKFFQ
jgi:hypothetical protein